MRIYVIKLLLLKPSIYFMNNLKSMKMHEEREVNSTTKAFRVENGIIWKFHLNDNVTSSCMEIIKKKYFIDSRPNIYSELR